MTNEQLTTRRYTTDKDKSTKPDPAIKSDRETRRQTNSSSRRRPDWLVILVALLFLSSMIIAWLVYNEH